jgi:subtilisin family serine protease
MRNRRSLLVVVTAAALILGAIPATAQVEVGGPDSKESQFAGVAEVGQTHRFVVEFTSRADVRAARTINDFAQRGDAVVDALRETAELAQAQAALLAREQGATVRQFWFRNVMVVEGLDEAGRAALEALPGVAAVRPEKVYPLVVPVTREEAVLAAAGDPEWGVSRIGADLVWEQGITGSGVVVANIDTGVDFTHPALVNQYRGNLGNGSFSHDYNWWDPTGICGDVPCDNVEHGTHVMGTMVGGDGPGPFTPDIGVAPDATWIAAKGCEDLGCSESALLSSGQWMLAPTDLTGQNPDPSKRPDIVNNSWSGPPGDLFFLEAVQNWRAAGIIPVFATGNPGPICGEGGSPSDYLESFGVGATDIDDVVAEFSGRGPSPYGKINPDVSAPGVDIVSSVPGGNYASFSGTSMASPHATGALALILSSTPDLFGDFAGATGGLAGTAVDIIDLTCGGDDDGDPNNVYGEGRIDALAAVQLVATGGILEGTVTDADTGEPIVGAKVSASDGGRDFNTTTDASGDYRMFLAAGLYSVTAVGFGYEAAVVSEVVIETDQTTTRDLALIALPRYTLSGKVVRVETDAPIAGIPVTALGTPVPPVTSNQQGRYSLTLPLGTYTVIAGESGCLSTDSADIELFEDTVHDFRLVQVIDDFGHGCSEIPFRWVDARSPTTMYGDDITGRLPLHFDFPFYDAFYDDVFISTNGYLSFVDEYLGFSDPYSVPIPDSAPPNAAIFALWQDLWAVSDEARVEYKELRQGRLRGMAIEYANIADLGEESGADFEVKLWENGDIDLLYKEGMSDLGAGGSATVGIEDELGSTGLQIGYRQSFFTDRTAYRITRVPTGFVAGTVTDLNDGLPLAGATITADPGGRSATTDENGLYTLRLVPGSYEVTATAPDYESEAAQIEIRRNRTTNQDFALAAPVAVVEPAEITGVVELGETTNASVTVSNSGSAPLVWEVFERDRGGTPPDLEPQPGSASVRPPTWGAYAPDSVRFDVAAEPVFTGPLEVIIDDPVGDAVGSVDLTTVLGGASDFEVSFEVDVTPDSPLHHLAGYVFLDTDQDPATGLPADALSGLTTQDVGMEYFVDLFGSSEGIGYLVDANTFEYIVEFPIEHVTNGIRFDIPLELLGGDDGAINVALVGGDFEQPTDWAPDEGHGTVEPFRDVVWMGADPSSGVVEPGDSSEVTVTLGSADVDPDSYLGSLIFLTNDPRRPTHEVAVELTVEMPADFGAVAGTVTNSRVGLPVPALIEIHAERDGDPYEITRQADDVDGTYRVFGPAGTWPMDVTFDGYAPFSGEVTIEAGTEAPFDVVLDPLWPFATLGGGPIVVELAPGGSEAATLSLGNADGLADLKFEVFELEVVAAGAPVPPSISPPAATESDGSSQAVIADDVRQPVERRAQQGSDAAVFMDLLPWESDALFQVLDAAGAVYDVLGSGDMGTADLSTYRVVFISNDQAQDFYDAYLENATRFEEYVAGGGLLWFGAASGGSNGGVLGDTPLPGGVSVLSELLEDYNDLVQPDHPVVAGVANRFFGTLASHAAFAGVGENSVIAAGTDSDLPTLVEYDVGAGRVLAFGQPMEWGWTHGEDSGLILANSVPYALAYEPFTDIPWLSVEPTSGTVEVGASTDLAIAIDATGLEPGKYLAQIVMVTNDPTNPRLSADVNLVVGEG